MTSNIYPSFRYRDARAAIDWLEQAFGFKRKVVYDEPNGSIAHAELAYGEGIVMLGSERPDDEYRRAGQGWAYVAVDDLDAHYERAKAAGAVIVNERRDQDYGSFYSAHDLEGNLWSFGTYCPGDSSE